MATSQSAKPAAPKELANLVKIFADKYKIDKDSVVPLINQISFMSAEPETVTTADILVLMVAANQYDLDPFMREIYALQNDYGRYEPVVSVAGWSKIISRQTNFGSVQFTYSPSEIIVDSSQKCPEWIECEIYTKNFERPTVVREYLVGNYRDTAWWGSNTSRQLRHKALIQCGRIAFGLTGIADADEIISRKQKPAKKQDANEKSEPKKGPLTGGLKAAKDAAAEKKGPAGKPNRRKLPPPPHSSAGNKSAPSAAA